MEVSGRRFQNSKVTESLPGLTLPDSHYLIDSREARGGPGVVCFPRTLPAFKAFAAAITLPPLVLPGVSLALEAPTEDLHLHPEWSSKTSCSTSHFTQGKLSPTSAVASPTCLAVCLAPAKQRLAASAQRKRGGEGSRGNQDQSQCHQCAAVDPVPLHQCCLHLVTWVGKAMSVFLLSGRAGSQVPGSPSS